MSNSPKNTPAEKPALEPRRYQLELLNYVEQRNAIIYLPTGSGKTYVAILALKRHSHKMTETIDNGGKRAVFMTNTVELARQQAIEVRKNSNLKVGLYIGERDVDNWSRKKWDEEIRENQVLVGTAQIFVDLVTQNHIKITDFSLVIIDECHHGTGKHPMHEFMRCFQYVADETKLPRVIGLTGVLLKGNKLGDISSELKTLEATYRGNIITVSSMEQFHNVMVYSTKPTEELITYSSEIYQFELSNTIKMIINNLCTVIDHWDLGNIPIKLTKGLNQVREPNKKNSVKNLLKDFIYQMEDLGLYAAAVAIMSPIIELEIRKRQAETLTLRNLYRHVITQCERIRHLILKKLKDLIDDDNPSDKDCHTLNVILNFSTPKLTSLLMYMKSKFEGKLRSDICCLVFVERRYTAKALYYVVQKFVELTPGLKDIIVSQFMVGRNSIAPGIEGILDRKWNASAIENFRNGDCNMIICSNVLEEGIDIQACNFVFAFDPLKTFSSYIQTKGRARSSGSTYAIFAPKINQLKITQQIKKYQETHEAIKKYLIGRILDRDDPKENDIDEQFVDEIPPFITKSGARLLASNAGNLLSRYCQTLPTDAFGLMTPWMVRLPATADGKTRVSVNLPLQSQVKETIIGDAHKNAKLSKISACFKACVRLYQEGELNERLLPVTKRECVQIVSQELFQHWEKFNDDVTRKSPGKLDKRLYERICPEEFYNAMPQVGQKSYAYAIQFQTNYADNSYNSHIIEMLSTATTYGILLRRPLPRLAEMPLFMNQGKLSVKIAEVPVECIISSEDDLNKLRKYHLMLFRELLDCWKNFFVLDKRNKQNSFLIVPLNATHIDWNLVNNFQHLPSQRPYTIAERQNQVFRPEDWQGKVINKWYSNNEQERFVVTKVHTDLNPQSPFNNSTYTSYQHFIESKYRSDVDRIVRPDQFLIEVKQLTSRRNFFINAVGKSMISNKDRSAIILIPETCHNFEYPGDMWLKAIMLPSILHRLHFMLHAETLRKRINRYLGLHQGAEAMMYRPKELVIDSSLKRVVDSDGNAMEDQEIPKKTLSALPPKKNLEINSFQIHSLVSEDTQWKDHLEPTDHTRQAESLYPVEIDYYFKFINGLATKMDALRLEEESGWTNSQFQMPEIKPLAPSIIAAGYQSDVPCLTDVPLADRRKLDILDRSMTNTKVGHAEQYEFLAALTTSGSNDVFDMERYELLGDSFLKFAISLYLINRYPKWNEGFLTEVKGKLVSNRNLLYCIFDSDIPKRICSSLFKPNCEWLPPLVSLPSNVLELLEQNLPLVSGISPGDLYALQLSEAEIMSGECSTDQLDRFINTCVQNQQLTSSNVEMNLENDMHAFINKERISDKVVADTLEALMGVCIKNYGIHRGFRMLEFFGICKADPSKPLTNLLDLNLKSSLLRANTSPREVDGLLINYGKLEENLGYHFKDRSFLLQALTHPSYPTNRLTGCYQELEFIGDAILDFLVSAYIFERNRNMTPGMLTDLRSALVNNITLACICVRHRFHLFILAENAPLAETIKRFADFQDTQGHRVTDQVRILMEEYNLEGHPTVNKGRYNMSVNVDVPKALGDILEALIAAVYLDSRDIKQTWHVIYHLMEQEFTQFSYKVPLDAVRQLYEHKNANAKFSDAVVDNDVVMIKCFFTCLDEAIEVTGFGVNSVQAKKAAAKHALQILSRHDS